MVAEHELHHGNLLSSFGAFRTKKPEGITFETTRLLLIAAKFSC